MFTSMVDAYPGWTHNNVADLTPGQLMLYWKHAAERNSDGGEATPDPLPAGTQLMDPARAAEFVQQRRAKQGGGNGL